MSTHVPEARMFSLCGEGEDILTKEELLHFAGCAFCCHLLQEIMSECAEERAAEIRNGIAATNDDDPD